jgi:hypothetical protein
MRFSYGILCLFAASFSYETSLLDIIFLTVVRFAYENSYFLAA